MKIIVLQFEPIAMVGGALWAIGNTTVVPIIGLIGLGLGKIANRLVLFGLFDCVQECFFGVFQTWLSDG